MYYNPDTKITPRTSDFLKANPQTIQVAIDPKRKRTSSDQPRAWWLYALELENDAYYIGITSKWNPYDRIMQHGSFLGSSWANLHKPVSVMEIRDMGYVTEREAKDFEQNLTWVYIRIYGHKNVRGGDITFTSSAYKFGNRIISADDLLSLMGGVMLIVLSIYIVFIEITR